MDLGKDIRINYSFCTIRYSVIAESDDAEDAGGYDDCDDRDRGDSSNFARSTHPDFPFVDVVFFCL